jgi:hypothetical protein
MSLLIWQCEFVRVSESECGLVSYDTAVMSA